MVATRKVLFTQLIELVRKHYDTEMRGSYLYVRCHHCDKPMVRYDTFKSHLESTDHKDQTSAEDKEPLEDVLQQLQVSHSHCKVKRNYQLQYSRIPPQQALLFLLSIGSRP